MICRIAGFICSLCFIIWVIGFIVIGSYELKPRQSIFMLASGFGAFVSAVVCVITFLMGLFEPDRKHDDA